MIYSQNSAKRPAGDAARQIGLWMCGIAMSAVIAPQVYAQDAAAGAVQAAEMDQGTIGEIIVTAQKRSESVQKTPLAVTAVSGDALRTSGIATVADLKQSVPTLQLGLFFGVPALTLRGITLNALGPAVEAPIAFHTDGVYSGRPSAALSGFYDVQRVEVLRGAQGTLYGRNATGGSINIITADPTPELDGFAQVTYGTDNHIAIEGAVGGPLSDKVQVRFAARSDSHDGYGVNEFTGNEIDDNQENAVRAKIKFLPTDNLTILLAGDYYHNRSHPGIHFQGTVSDGPLWGVTPPPFLVGFVPGVGPSKLRNISQDYDPLSTGTFWGLSSTIDLDLGDIALKSITAYRRSKSESLGDVDLTSAALISPARVADDAHQFSQELQIIGSNDSANWIVGAYYFHEKDVGSTTAGFSNAYLWLFGGAPSTIYNAQGLYSGSQVKTKAYAIFGQYTQHVTDQLSLTVGGRYSIETKEFINQNTLDLVTPFDLAFMGTVPSTLAIQCGKGLPTIGYAGTGVTCDPDSTWKAFTPKVGIDFQLTPQTLIYASYTRGFKSGAFNLGIVQDPVRPEKLDDFELGIKSTFLDGKLRTNLAGFYYKYKDVQVFNAKPAQVVLENAASAKLYGIEAEIVAKPTPAFQIDLNGAWLHTEYVNYIAADQLRPGGDSAGTKDPLGQPAFNLKGNRLPQAPRLSGTLGMAYTIGAGVGDFTLRGEVAYTSKLFITQFNTDPVGAVKARTRFNASLRFNGADGHLYASLNAKNLGDKVQVVNGYANSPLVGGAISGYLEAPRTIDFTVGYKF